MSAHLSDFFACLCLFEALAPVGTQGKAQTTEERLVKKRAHAGESSSAVLSPLWHYEL